MVAIAPKVIKQKFVVDASGSMHPQRHTVISGFNEQISTMKIEEQRDNVKYLVSLTLFEENVKFVYKDLPLVKVPRLTEEMYECGGWTALYDGIGRTIDTARQGETDTIVTIMTDGKENRSKTWKKAGVKAVIDIRQRENKWGFVYFGANQNAWEEAANVGILNAVNYNVERTKDAIHSMSAARSVYTCSALNNTYSVSGLTSNIGDLK